jgi:hypothetical protein
MTPHASSTWCERPNDPRSLLGRIADPRACVDRAGTCTNWRLPKFGLSVLYVGWWGVLLDRLGSVPTSDVSSPAPRRRYHRADGDDGSKCTDGDDGSKCTDGTTGASAMTGALPALLIGALIRPW